jgi:hypothetical protein
MEGQMAGRGFLSKYFIGAGVKVLRGTEVDPTISNGHELQGVDTFRKFLGTPSEKQTIPVTYVWMDDEQEEPTIQELTGTWYDSRKNQPHRGAEYRFYYPKPAAVVVHKAKAGDTLFLSMTADGKVLAIFCPSGSSAEQKLLWLFGLTLQPGFDLAQKNFEEEGGRDVDLAAKFILDELGIEAEEPEPDALELLLKTFGAAFPETTKFSTFARNTLKEVDALADPDAALVAWMDHEEALFRHLERVIVAERLKTGFMSEVGADVDGFLSFSLSVQNRRKSRAGYAFAHHVEAVLREWNVAYKREATTEKRNAADFLFPSEEAYRDLSFPEGDLRMLAVKTTCKDRWRQVLAEANRIKTKHLLTLEPAISVAQTEEMQASSLVLVVPCGIHATYKPNQREALLDVKTFVSALARKVVA